MTESNLSLAEATFCAEYVEHGNASQAYREAFADSKTVGIKAARLLKQDKIQAEIQRLREELAERHRITVESLIEELEEARQLALSPDPKGKVNSVQAAVAATMGKAKLAGLLVDKQSVEHSGGVASDMTVDMSKLTKDQLKAISKIKVE